MRVFGEQQNPAGGSKYEKNANQWLLYPGVTFLRPVESNRCEQRRANGGNFDLNSVWVPIHRVRCDHTKSRNLGNRQIDKNDASFQNFMPQRHMGTEYD